MRQILKKMERVVARTPTKVLRPRNRIPIVSFTFDDVPLSAGVTAASILEGAGAAGTYYASGSLCGTALDCERFLTREELIDLQRSGHEVGCHTFSHVPVTELDRRALVQELDENAQYFADGQAGGRLENFAYPFGQTNLSAKRRLARRYSTCRSSLSGINSGLIDLSLLRAVALYDRLLDRFAVRAWLASTLVKRAWLIFYTHDVRPQPSRYGTSTDLFQFAVSEAGAMGLDVLPVRDALRRLTSTA
jgi:peptidoglycan/xylan/chitin deacetylase (PgdA/CDA1 family)